MGRLIAFIGIWVILRMFEASSQAYSTTVVQSIGTTFELECEAADFVKDPEPNITWYKDDDQSPIRSVGQQTQNKWAFEMKEFAAKDRGNYTCVMCNIHGCRRRGFTVVALENYSSKPVLQNVTVDENGIANLSCAPAIIGSYNYIVWLKQTQYFSPQFYCLYYKPSEEDRISEINSTSGEIYTMYNVTHEDEGSYICAVKNSSIEVRCTIIDLKVKDGIPKEQNQKDGGTSTYLATIGCIAGVLFCFAVVGILLVKERKRRLTAVQQAKKVEQWIKKIIVEIQISQDNHHLPREIPVVRIERHKIEKNESNSSILSEYELPKDDGWEFPRNDLRLGKTLGEGNFCKVVMAEVLSKLPDSDISIVAVKMLKDSHTDSDIMDLVQEMEIMKMIGKHENVLNILGCCTQDGPLHVILEYAPYGNLRDFLREHQPASGYGAEMYSNFTLDKSLSHTDLITFAYQIAKGMEYLASRRFVHRDLAARNILVSDNYTMKIADFGLARDINETDYYYKKSDGRLPVKWMAPETLLYRKYSSQSDVWSFGILLWEIMSYGGSPYPLISSFENLLRLLQSGQRMDRPSQCSCEVYEIMRDCWSYERSDRPTFSDLVNLLNTHQTKAINEEFTDTEFH